MKNYSFDNLCAYFDQLSWTSFFALSDPEDIWHGLYTIYINGLNTLAPNVDIKCREKENWVSSVLLDLIRERDKFKVLAEADPCNTAYEKFKELRNECKRTIIKDKRAFIRSKLINSKGPKKGKKEIISLTDDKGTEIFSTSFTPTLVLTYHQKLKPIILHIFSLAKTLKVLPHSLTGNQLGMMKYLT